MKLARSFKTALFVSAFLISPLAKSQVVINEYSCSNFNTITDNYGETEDWIELYNASGATVDLTGWYLSDKASQLDKWPIPSGTINAGGFKMIMCSGRNTVNGAELHPNFNLKQTQNEWIILSNNLLNVVDSFKIVHMTKADHSVGRSTNGAPDFKLFVTPTPGANNTGAVNFYEPTPVMSVAPGFYPGAQSVTLTCSDPGATIRYTTDGSNPTVGSTAYTGPININSTTVLRAAAYGADQPSFIATSTYFINVTHTVPVVSVCSQDVYNLVANGNQGWGPTANKWGHFELFEEDGSFIDGGQGHFNKHGNDSWSYQQRGFDFIMRDQFGINDDLDHKIFPEKSRQDFQRVILKPGASDNYPFENGGAHIRDAFVHTLSDRADMLVDERTWRPCVVYLNGQYWGVYEIREKADDHDFTDYYYNQDKFNLQYLKTWGGTWQEYGAPQALTDWNALKNFILTNNMAPGPNFDYVQGELKWKSLCDYFMINSITVNKDWLNWNTAWWRGRDPNGEKLKWRWTLWDMDATFGHYINYTGIPDPSANADPCNAENLNDPGGQGHTEILQKLLAENPVVEQYYITRYTDLLNTHFSCPSMIALLDSMVNEITPEMPGQIAKWGGSMAQWNANVQEIRDFINDRCAAINQGMIDCYTLDGPYDVTFDVTPVGAGTIKVNSIFAPTYPWSTQYFGGIETLTIAFPNVGFVFDHWEFTVGPMNNPIAEDTNGVNLTANDYITAVFIPETPDMDGDGCLNTDEILAGTDPMNPDTDGDGVNDCDEIGADPNNPLDNGGDGLIDALDPCFPNLNSPTCDSDGDGLFNYEEMAGCSDTSLVDTDGDGLTDYEEVTGIDDPSTALVPSGISDECSACSPTDANPIDDDGDGVSLCYETEEGTDPLDPCSYNIADITMPITSGSDCDNDGITDAQEIADGTDPFDQCDPNNVGIECALGIYVPTGFSPNGSGLEDNETLKLIVGIDVVSFTFQVYDRWGNRMVRTSEKTFEWDGTSNGEPCNSGVYAYVLEVVFEDGHAELRTGNITLIR